MLQTLQRNVVYQGAVLPLLEGWSQQEADRHKAGASVRS